MRTLALAALLAPAAFAQFALYQVDGAAERPVGAVFDLGAVYPSESAAARFRIRNTSGAPAALTLLAVRGAGFTLADAPPLPAALASQQTIDFSVDFQSGGAAGYSASLEADGIAVLLTATVLPRLTYQIGTSTLGAAPVDFGLLEAGASTFRRISVTNLTGLILTLPAISVTGAAFSISDPPVGGVALAPSQSTSFDVVFSPPAAGTWTGLLTIGDRSYDLAGAALGPPLPHPRLSVDLADARSGRQGAVSVGLDAPAKTAGAGTLTLDFQPLASGAVDSAIRLGVVGRSLPFTIAPGDTAVRFGDLDAVAFQTGTTAGTIVLAVELGGSTDRQTVAIPPAPVAIQSAQAVKTAQTIDLRIAGFDNTRTAGPIVYTFYDTTGNAIATIPVDNTSDFAQYFAASDAGGAFSLRALFPVAGDLSKIDAFAVQMTNSAGSAATGKIKF